MTDQEAREVEQSHFATIDEAKRYLMEKVQESDGSNGYTLNLSNDKKHKDYVVIVSNIAEDKNDVQLYTVASLSPDKDGYKVKILNKNVELSRQAIPTTDEFTINETVYSYYIGPEKDNPFADDAQGVYSPDNNYRITFSSEGF
ncbi:hypothetical protein ERX29_10440 [Macrococcus lamae]|uniref:Uncharacterized protein n=2 Tax=Macrococcus lamae TaxID=198484 RepID=A0A4R6BSP7_9STAP|nr:hypothetical protein ERX29_10440 [Macrococcus lamae]